jgi:glycosyltransferase involved in cell wall biosynthesis
MRILQLNSARKYIGEAAHTLNLTEALRRDGHSVWLGMRKGYESIERAEARKLEPIGFHMPHRWWPPQDGPDIQRIARLIRDHRIDIVHAHRGKDHWQALFASKWSRTRVPVIRTRHVVTPLSANPANRWLARRTAAMVCVSQAVEQDVRRTRLFPEDRLVFIPGGIDLDLFKPADPARRAAARTALKLPADAPVVVCVARFAVVKAHRVLLEAWKMVNAQLPAARLLLVGGGLLFDECSAQAKSLGLEDSIHFLGKRIDVPEILDAADAGVLSSVGSEGFSRAVLEYMAKGLPSVGTRVGAVPDLIDDGVHGFVVAPNDATALSAALLKTLRADETQRKTWGAAARQKAERSHGFAGWSRAHLELYTRVLGK